MIRPKKSRSSRLFTSALLSLMALACKKEGPDDEQPSPSGSRSFGAPCKKNSDCQSAHCFLESTPLFEQGGPPGGFCTAPCEDRCEGGGVCTSTLEGNFCFPACDFGDDPKKCGERENYVCSPVLTPGKTSCTSDAACAEGSLCILEDESDPDSGLCSLVQGFCSPLCQSDDDCSEGRYCHPSSGECQSDKPQGAEFGASCELGSADCRGQCIAISSSVSECEERCRIGATSGCGADDLSQSDLPLACAYFAYSLADAGIEQGSGDLGICAKLCSCNADCPGAQLCLPSKTKDFAGICTGGIALESSLPCEDGGGGGAGGGGP